MKIKTINFLIKECKKCGFNKEMTKSYFKDQFNIKIRTKHIDENY